MPLRKNDSPSTSRCIVTTPWLQMKGYWLANAGFDHRTTVKVRVMPGSLVLTAEEN
ncbi:MAG: SymE family type I addiction module toxin [Candidatus Thiodiazotropha sp. 4PDIVS1]